LLNVPVNIVQQLDEAFCRTLSRCASSFPLDRESTLNSILDPPETILAEIFPWVEQEQEVLVKREHANRLAKDIALRQFLTTLIWFRRVLIQDMAVLYTQAPDAPIFKTAPFNLITFREFAATSTAAIHLAEKAARLAFQNLPEHLVASMRGALVTQNLGFERERHGYKLLGLLQLLLGSDSALCNRIVATTTFPLLVRTDYAIISFPDMENAEENARA
jgi:hypothetical protein